MLTAGHVTDRVLGCVFGGAVGDALGGVGFASAARILAAQPGVEADPLCRARCQIAQIFSAPARDYAPGTDYLTRSWGWRRHLTWTQSSRAQ